MTLMEVRKEITLLLNIHKECDTNYVNEEDSCYLWDDLNDLLIKLNREEETKQ